MRAEVFADFLEMAEHLLTEGYKDPSAVLIGGVLEEHLRALCTLHEIATTSDSSRPKKADQLNVELTKVGVYNRLDQKSITTWLDLRNKAAHGHYDEYAQRQVQLMAQGVRDFLARVSV